MTNPPVSEQFCATCRYWREQECRRHGPLVDPDWEQGCWPPTQATDWCGEWVSRD